MNVSKVSQISYNPQIQFANDKKSVKNTVFNSPLLKDVVNFTGITNPNKEVKIQEIVNAIKGAKNIAIIGHSRPDGDAVGSTAALRELIAQTKGKDNVKVFVAGDIPEGFKNLEDTKSFVYVNKETPEEILNEKFDLVISVDTSEKYLIDKKLHKIFYGAGKTIKIDHHSDGSNFANINLVDPKASAASQILLDFVKPLGAKLTSNIASDIYLGIVADTVGLRALKDSKDVFKDVYDLSKANIDMGKIYSYAMDTMSKPFLDLYADVIKNIQLSKDGTVAYFIEDKEFQKKYSPEINKDRINLSNMYKKVINSVIPNIKGVKVGLLLRELGFGTVTMLRGNGESVNDIAKQFDGGGHEFAAGCTIYRTKPDEALKILLEAINEKRKNQQKSKLKLLA